MPHLGRRPQRHLPFDGRPVLSPPALPGLAERTIVVGSAGSSRPARSSPTSGWWQELAGLPAVPPGGGWSLLLDAAPPGHDAEAASRLHPGGARRAGVTYSDEVLGEVLTAILTPFGPDGSVDVDAFRRLASHLVDNGSDGLVVAGTTGEAPTLSDEEKLELFAAAVDAVGARATVVANTGTYDTYHSAHLTGEAHDLGVHGILAVAPYYNKPPQRGIVRHFQEIACMTDKPVLAYNIPSRVVVNIEPVTVDELAQIENLAGVKQAHGDIAQAKHIVEAGLALYAGDDNLVLPFLEVGGEGGVCVHSHIWGAQTKEMVRRYKSGDAAGAKALNDEMAPAFDLLRIQVNPIPIKAAMSMLGHDVGGHRLPLVDATDDELARVRACLERAGVLQTART